MFQYTKKLIELEEFLNEQLFDDLRYIEALCQNIR